MRNSDIAKSTVDMILGAPQNSGISSEDQTVPQRNPKTFLSNFFTFNPSSNIESQLAHMYREDWSVTSPYLKQLLADGAESTKSSAIVDAARRQIQRTALGYNESVNNRQANRANIHLTPSQQLAMSSSRAMGATLNNTANVNTARINQYDANINALNRLVASTNAMKKGASSSLDQIAGNEANRRMQNDAAKAQAKQARNANIAAAASIAMTAIMI